MGEIVGPQCFKCGSITGLWGRIIRRTDIPKTHFKVHICDDCYVNKPQRGAKPISLPIPICCLLPETELSWSLSEGPP